MEEEMFKKNMLKRVLTTGAAFLLAWGLTACGDQSKASSQQDENDSKNQVIHVGCVGQSNTLNEAAGIAQEMGYFDEELEKVGYELEVVGFAQAGPAINEAFSADKIEMAFYGDMPATICKSSGVDTTVFATQNSEMQMGVLVQKDSDIKSVADLKGHKVIVARGTIYHQYFKSLIAGAGIDESEIEQINTFSDAQAVMAGGDADALITSTSIAHYMEGQGIGELIETTEDHPEWTSQFFAVGKTEFLKENPNAAKAIIKGLIRGQQYVKENKEESYELMAKRQSGYTKEIYEKVYAYDEGFDYLKPEITKEGMDKLKAMEQFLEDEKLISKPVDMDNFVDTSYYEDAIGELKD